MKEGNVSVPRKVGKKSESDIDEEKKKRKYDEEEKKGRK